MVGLVLVSHSALLAEGLAELLRSLAGDEVSIVAAGGGPDGDLGTDGDRIANALGAADSGEGCVVLVDIGSAILSVTAVLAEEPGVNATLVDAPLVEGGVAAAVLASTGASLDEVAQAAEGARGAGKL
jgi:phosphoenolpyruvate---glycerone phosphotransferase subunit DhaM